MLALASLIRPLLTVLPEPRGFISASLTDIELLFISFFLKHCDQPLTTLELTL